MPRFHFDLRHGAGVCRDEQGAELADAHEARAYAGSVVQELMSHRENETRHWVLEVRDEADGLLCNIPFATVDHTLDHLRPEWRMLIQRLSENRRLLAETIADCRITVLRSRAIRARTQRRPYLVAQDGRQI